MEPWAAHATVAVGTMIAVTIAVMVHYEGLVFMATRFSNSVASNSRRHVLLVIFGVLLLHVVEIWVFGGAWWGLLRLPDTGHVADGAPGLHESIYLSALAYTSMGFDAANPIGAISLLAGMEALTGLVLIAWSASFTYLVMARHWHVK
jgi:uncharacterized protein YhhL (DUF1145 family)